MKYASILAVVLLCATPALAIPPDRHGKLDIQIPKLPEIHLPGSAPTPAPQVVVPPVAEASPAAPSAHEGCKPADEAAAVWSGMSKAHPGTLFKDFDGEKAQKFLKFFNSIPPVSDEKAERVLMFVGPQISQYSFVHNGEACGIYRLPTDALHVMLTQAFKGDTFKQEPSETPEAAPQEPDDQEHIKPWDGQI